MEAAPVSISVILPAYNTAGYLGFALRNLTEGQFGGLDPAAWEIIVVDDGSTDNPQAAVKPALDAFPGSVRFVSTPNRGVSAARNTGLDMARGRYVYFIDSDDIMLRGSLPALCHEADRTGADMVKFVFRDIDSGLYSRLTDAVPDASLDPDDFHLLDAGSYLQATRGLTGPPSHHATWSTIYRREFLATNRLRFNEALSIGEDIIMTWRAMLCRPRVLYADRALYLYHHRDGSAINARGRDKLLRQSAAYMHYLGELLDVQRRVGETFGRSDTIGRGLADNLRYGTNRALETLVLAGASPAEIYRAMKRIKKAGGDIHPGRPRFNRDTRRTASPRCRLRRWIAAYILALFA